ncbi:hypothetical protein NCS56_01515900 [Fusarium sp. Ph1]|nr:hypothetical protein NCS56_01515900 [Fusarium sp. Ph1]
MEEKRGTEATGRAVAVEDVEIQGAGVLLYEEDGHARKLPVPSSDPNDPLNFGDGRQRLILAAVCVYGVAAFGTIQSTSLFLGNLVGEYKVQTHGAFDPKRITELASYPSLCMGLGNFFFVPLSMALGRRFVFILSNILLLASIVWAAKSQSFESHLGARCLQGLAAGVADCLLPIIVLDTSFLYKRSARLIAYWTLTAVGSSLLLVPVTFIVEHANGDWRVSYWYWLAFTSFSLVVVVFCVPETLFVRHAAEVSGRIHATDAYGTHRTFATAEAARSAGFEIESEHSEHGGPKTASYMRQFGPIQVQPSPAARFLGAYRDIFICIFVPGTFWALLFNSMVFGGVVVLSLTYSARLEMPPWNFSQSAVGTAQAGAALGALFGLAFGEMAEPISRYLTRRNHGIRKPEHVLPNFILPLLLYFLGIIIYGVVAADPQKYSWVGIHASFALVYFGFIAISALTSVWLGELLPHMSGPAIVLTCGGRNAISFGYTGSFNSWVEAVGLRGTYVLFGGILFALGSLCIPLYFVNGRIRKAMQAVPWLKAH